MLEAQRGTVIGPALMVCMIGIVTLNLVFVQLTGAADPAWMAALYGLTLAAPLLARFRELLAYRMLWNVGILAVFAGLIDHALSRDLEYLLQDGLVLAALTQVHLLNNLRGEQRPDLLFVNSYLIAAITGYITSDLAFAAAFIIFAPFFLVGLQLLSLARPGRSLRPEHARLMVKDGLKRSGLLLALTALVFVFWPRDFSRPAMFADRFDMAPPAGAGSTVAFSERLNLGDREGTSESQRVALTVHIESGDGGDFPRYWRGAVLTRLGRDGSYLPMETVRRGGSSKDWELRSDGLAMRRIGAQPGAMVLSLVRPGGGTQRLFLPPSARTAVLDDVHRAGRLEARPDGTATYSNPGELRYRITVDELAAPLGLGGEPADFLGVERSIFTNAAIGLARELAKREGPDAAPLGLARSMADRLGSVYPYRAPGAKGAATTLHEFMTTRAGGSCEFFASALATMLRAEGVPARVVTGYLVPPLEPGTRKVIIRDLHAHAWVEAFDEATGWVTVDATPAAPAPGAVDRLADWLGGSLGAAWARVKAFDAEARAELMGDIAGLPAAAGRFAIRRPYVAIGFLAALVLLGVAFRRRQVARTPATVRHLRGALQRAGLSLEPGETPRSLVRRARESGHGAELVESLEQAVRYHERERYAR